MITAGYVLTTIQSLVLAYLYFKKPYFLLKPSYIFLIGFNLLFQWSSAFHVNHTITGGKSAQGYLGEQYMVFFILTFVFPLVMLGVTAFVSNKEYHNIFKEVTQFNIINIDKGNLFLFFSTIYLVLVGIWYFSNIPFTETGLYKTIIGVDALQARERSLKLLPNKYLVYAQIIFVNSIFPVFSLIALGKLKKFVKEKKLLPIISLILLSLCSLILLSVTGARAIVMVAILPLLLFVVLSHRDWFKSPINVLVLFIMLIASPVLFHYLRNNGSATFYKSFLIILERMFVRTIIDGMDYVKYVAEFDFFGIAGIPKLATLFHVDPVNIFNVVGVWADQRVSTVSANTPFIYSTYACFGLWTLPICILQLMLFDSMVFLYKYYNYFKVPLAISMAVIAIHLYGAMFNTLFITYGLLVIPVMLFAFEKIYAKLLED